MADFISPVIYDEDGKVHRPAADTDQLNPANIPLSAQNNLVTRETDGLSVRISTEMDQQLSDRRGVYYNVADHVSIDSANVLKSDARGDLLLDPRDVVSPDDGNFISADSNGKAFVGYDDIVATGQDQRIEQASDGKLIVREQDVLSLEDGNYIRFGNDQGLYLNGNDVLSNEANNALGISEVDGKITLREDDLDLGYKACPGDFILTNNEAGRCISAEVGLAYNAVTGRLDILGKDGLTVIATITIPSSSSVLRNVSLEVDPSGQPTGTYLHFDFILSDGTDSHIYVNVTDLVDIYTGGQGVLVEDDVISVRIVDGGGLHFVGNDLDVDFAGMLSGDANNQLTQGTDGKLLVAAPVVTWDSVQNKPATFPPSRHAMTHAQGGSDPLTLQDIGFPVNGVAGTALTSTGTGLAFQPVPLLRSSLTIYVGQVSASATNDGLAPERPVTPDGLVAAVSKWHLTGTTLNIVVVEDLTTTLRLTAAANIGQITTNLSTLNSRTVNINVTGENGIGLQVYGLTSVVIYDFFNITGSVYALDIIDSLVTINANMVLQAGTVDLRSIFGSITRIVGAITHASTVYTRRTYSLVAIETGALVDLQGSMTINSGIQTQGIFLVSNVGIFTIGLEAVFSGTFTGRRGIVNSGSGLNLRSRGEQIIPGTIDAVVDASSWIV